VASQQISFVMLLTPSDRRHVSQTVELIKVREHHLTCPSSRSEWIGLIWRHFRRRVALSFAANKILLQHLGHGAFDSVFPIYSTHGQYLKEFTHAVSVMLVAEAS